MIRKHSDFKYETPFKFPYESFQTWTNGTIILQTGAVTTRINIPRIKHYYNLTDLEWHNNLQKILTYIYNQHIYM